MTGSNRYRASVFEAHEKSRQGQERNLRSEDLLTEKTIIGDHASEKGNNYFRKSRGSPALPKNVVRMVEEVSKTE